MWFLGYLFINSIEIGNNVYVRINWNNVDNVKKILSHLGIKNKKIKWIL